MKKRIVLTENQMNYLSGLLLTDCDNKVSKQIIKKLQEKKIKTSSAKGKGRNLQYWVCEHLAYITGLIFNQKDDQSPIRSREMGQHGVDIVFRGEAEKLLPYSIECKSTEYFDLEESVQQAAKNKKLGTDWTLIFKSRLLDNPVVIISWNHFADTIKNRIKD